jgi:hypothetical protein
MKDRPEHHANKGQPQQAQTGQKQPAGGDKANPKNPNKWDKKDGGCGPCCNK